MTKHDYKQTAFYLIYLIRCVLNDRIPAKEKLDKIDLSQLYEVAKNHSLTAMAAYALESAGVYDERFTQAKAKAIRKNAMFDIERERIFAEFEKAGIWYMPLKGIILNEYYPKNGMRQMCDNDVLIDKSRIEDIKTIMCNLGFDMEHDDLGHDMAFIKKPVCNFEIHTELFGVGHDEKMNQYYYDVKSRLIESPNQNSYHFSNEDFYLFMVAHEYKHFYLGGTGLRSLIDTYVYIKQYCKSLDRRYIDAELDKLGIKEYENNSRTLAFALYDGIRLTDDEGTLLDYYIFSGTYGNTENSIKNRLNKNNGSKAKYAISRILLPMEKIRKQYPLFYKHPILMPLLPLYRVIGHNSIKRIINEIKTLIKL